MRTYTLHVPPGSRPGEAEGLDRAVLVPDGFAKAAFAFGPLWFVYHRLWIAAALVLASLIALATIGRALQLSPVAGSVVTTLALVLIGLEASSLRRWTYARQGRPSRDAVMAASAEEAEAKALTRWLDPSASPRPGLSPYAAPAGRPIDSVIGLFPLNETPRREAPRP